MENIYKISNVIDERTYELFIPLKNHSERALLGDFLIVEYPIDDPNKKQYVLQIIEERTATVSDYEKLITLNSTNSEDLETFDIDFSIYLVCTTKLIGYIDNGELKTDIRRSILPIKSKIRLPNKKELKLLTNPNKVNENEENKIGYFTIGNKIYEEYPIYFDPISFKERRTAVFAKTGFGKSNLVKLLLLKVLEYNKEYPENKFGIFIFDVDGEYAQTNPQNPGFTQLDKKIIFVTNKNVKNTIPLKINFSQLDPDEVSEILKVAFKRDDLVGLNILRSKLDPEIWKDLWKNKKEDKESHLVAEELRELLNENKDVFNLSEASINALIWRLDVALRELHSFKGLTKETIKKYIVSRDFVIFDLSSIEEKWGKVITEFISRNSFKYSQDLFLNNKKTNILFIFEEAQNYLNENENIYTRITKEGRKFGIGTILITQQPSAIPNEIISQVDNFFVLHLLNNKDIGSLIYANPHYEPVSKFIQNESIKGVAYVYYGITQPYVLPVKILEFKKEVKRFENNKNNEITSLFE